MLDQGASNRIGQRPAHSPVNILRVATNADRPVNAHHGQVAFVETGSMSWIWSDPDDSWQPFGGGIEFYAQATPPSSAGHGAFWLDTAP